MHASFKTSVQGDWPSVGEVWEAGLSEALTVEVGLLFTSSQQGVGRRWIAYLTLNLKN